MRLHDTRTMNRPFKLGFVGLGAMGFPMASNLISRAAHGSKIFVYDISESVMRQLAEAHPGLVVTCDSPGQVSRCTVSTFSPLVNQTSFLISNRSRLAW